MTRIEKFMDANGIKVLEGNKGFYVSDSEGHNVLDGEDFETRQTVLDAYEVYCIEEGLLKVKKMRIFNGEDVAITIVSDGNADVVIQPKEYATVEIDHVSKGNQDGVHNFGSDSFYVEEEGAWYGNWKGEDSMSTVADLEIYKS